MAPTATAPSQAPKPRAGGHGAVRRRRGGAGFSQAPGGRVALSATGSRWRRACRGLGVPPLRTRLTRLRASIAEAGGFAEVSPAARQDAGLGGGAEGLQPSRSGERAGAGRAGSGGIFFSVRKLLRWGWRGRRPPARQRTVAGQPRQAPAAPEKTAAPLFPAPALSPAGRPRTLLITRTASGRSGCGAAGLPKVQVSFGG